MSDLFAERATFSEGFSDFEKGDYVWIDFRAEDGTRETFLLDDPRLACFLEALDGELMTVSYMKTERYFEAGGGAYEANIITELEAKNTSFSDWVAETSPDWRNCI